MNLSTAIKLAKDYSSDHQIGTTLIVKHGKEFALVTGVECIEYQKTYHKGDLVAEFESTWEWQPWGNGWKKVNVKYQIQWLMPELNPSQSLSKSA